MITVSIGCFVAFVLFTLQKYNIHIPVLTCVPCRAFWLCVVLSITPILMGLIMPYEPFVSGVIAIIGNKFLSS